MRRAKAASSSSGEVQRFMSHSMNGSENTTCAAKRCIRTVSLRNMHDKLHQQKQKNKTHTHFTWVLMARVVLRSPHSARGLNRRGEQRIAPNSLRGAFRAPSACRDPTKQKQTVPRGRWPSKSATLQEMTSSGRQPQSEKNEPRERNVGGFGQYVCGRPENCPKDKYGCTVMKYFVVHRGC